MEPQNAPAQPMSFEPPQKPKAAKSKMAAKKILMVLLIIALAAGGAAAYWLRDKSAKNEQKQQAAAIVKLKQQITDTQKELDAEKAKNAQAAATPAPKVVTPPSAAAIESIKASITSGNTAALQGYMASTVSVIIAASEGIGNRTPAQAVADITSYIKNATAPWNFALPAATLTTYRAGFYGQYFPTSAVVGKSADDMVISFSFNDSGKISTVFMAAKASLLQ
ncbi:MAG TPA: hypothetical protein VLE74_00550 [Candidatus Saccharimonadales bacterium]|nr:hypothetical protein [Candidatus Saccharimonadales bacterium]